MTVLTILRCAVAVPTALLGLFLFVQSSRAKATNPAERRVVLYTWIVSAATIASAILNVLSAFRL